MKRPSTKRGKNGIKTGGNSLSGFPQRGLGGLAALLQLVVERVHGAKLPKVFKAQCYPLHKRFFSFFGNPRFLRLLSGLELVFPRFLYVKKIYPPAPNCILALACCNFGSLFR
ncbi:MAG: hypothetical protein EOO62_13380 [Hymenobacter sp.]|nr:MAG: hypothetical protein EOO62_13380 [Hymenobacter sp.]